MSAEIKYKIIPLGEEFIVVDDSGKWFESRVDAVNSKLEEIETQLPEWRKEALAALEKGEDYRGGGILKLAELLRKKSKLRSILGYKTIPDKI